MDKTKKILFFIITIIGISILIITVILLNSKKNENVEKDKLDKQEQAYLNSINNPASVVNGNKPENIQYETVYITVKGIINKYFEYCVQDNEIAVNSVLDKENTNTNKTTNISIDQMDGLYIDEIYELSGVEYYQFFVKGIVDNKDIYIEVNQDTKNKTFSIDILDKSEFEENINTTINNRSGKENEIIKNGYNEYEQITMNEDDIAQAYFEDIKDKMLLYPQKAYDILDKEYKNKKFPNYNEFSIYIEENKEKIQNSIATKYLFNTDNGTKQLICVDENENTYTFIITSAMKYTVLLDNYTIETEEFKNDYSNLSEQEKIATNIDKFIKCINNKDYNQAYSFLDEGFKNNYFKNVEMFKKYITNKFYNNNIVKDIQIENEGDIFICTITLKSGLGAGALSTQKIINLKLKENTDFVMSFNIE